MKLKLSAALAIVSLSLVAVPAPAQPPDHAKAHGWRKKNDPNYVGYTGKKWEKDYGVVQGRCNSAQVGAVLGGAAGAVIGAKTSDRENRPVAVILGTTIGAIIGAKIGQSIDEGDRGCMGHALELAGEKKTVVWTNKATGVTYRLTPTRDFKQGSEACREFTTALRKGETKDSVKGVACRGGNGEWVFKL
jgi:surface antigen